VTACRIVLVVLFTVCVGSAASARQDVVRVEVRADDEPVEGALVSVGPITATTDGAGRASLRLPPGAHTVVVTKDGFVDVSTTLTVAAGQDAALVDAIRSAHRGAR
jgi:hypothetical protein